MYNSPPSANGNGTDERENDARGTGPGRCLENQIDSMASDHAMMVALGGESNSGQM